MPRKRREGEGLRLPRTSLVLYSIAAFSLLLLIVACLSRSFADAYNRTVGAAFRAVMAHATSWIPFSLAELLLYLLIPFTVFLVVIAYRRYCDTWREVLRFLLVILSGGALLFSVFVFTLGIGHRTTSLEEHLSLPEMPVNEETLARTAQLLVEELNVLSEQITYGEDGFSVMPYELSELNDKLLEAYRPLCERYAFLQQLDSRVKPVLASRAMSYTHITGVYSFYTGEANLNTYFPDYTIPFTAAHELAHQRGIARENEANFIAFLVAKESADTYIRYCGYLNLFEYVANALYRESPERYREIALTLSPCVRGELAAYAEFFEQFEGAAAADVSGAVNDAYLKLNGSEAGGESYGLVVTLAVAYFG